MKKIIAEPQLEESAQTETPVRLLIVEDDPDDAALCLHALKEGGIEAIADIVQTRDEFVEKIRAKSYDLVITDHHLPNWKGTEVVSLVRTLGSDVTVILVTGTLGDEDVVECLHLGITDVVFKDRLGRLPDAVRRSLMESRLRQEALRAKQSLAQANRTLSNQVCELQAQSDENNAIRDALFQEKELAMVTLNSIGDAVVCTDIWGNISFLNLVAEKMTGWLGHDAVGRPLAEVLRILDAGTRETIPNPMKMEAGRLHSMHLPPKCVLIRRDGFEIPIEDSVAPIHDREGDTTGAVIVFRDVSAARAMAEEMAHSAQHDFLTGLPNRLLVSDRMNQAIRLASRHNKRLGVLFLDLDGFKHINDSLGHAIGDKLLQSIAKRLVKCVRGADTVSRQGGDEFVVLLSEMEKAEDAGQTATRILHAVAEAHPIDQHDLHVSTSIGVSVYPDDGLDAETLIKNADTAMYQAKENARQSYQFFKPAMNVRAVERQSIEEGLRRAVQRQEFTLHYQPKINLSSGEITGAEALIRWTHPTLGVVPPGKFIPVAEDCGLILPIGNWVLREACRQARAWMDGGMPMITMAVNISAIEFRDEKFLGGVFDILEETGLDPEFLELELTESVLMRHAESTEAILKGLRGRGVQLAVDDFGTGYSSLSYLRKFPINALKIDQSFVRQIAASSNENTIVAAVIGMGQSLKLRVIAEGVETPEELEFLQNHLCDEAQGYYFGRTTRG